MHSSLVVKLRNNSNFFKNKNDIFDLREFLIYVNEKNATTE